MLFNDGFDFKKNGKSKSRVYIEYKQSLWFTYKNKLK